MIRKTLEHLITLVLIKTICNLQLIIIIFNSLIISSLIHTLNLKDKKIQKYKNIKLNKKRHFLVILIQQLKFIFF